jgi:heat shock protein HslJ
MKTISSAGRSYLKTTTLALLVIALVLTACGDSSAADVEGNWQLVSGNADGVAIEPEAANPLTIEFEAETFSGHGGCNAYSGSYTQDGSTIDLSEIAITQMACEALDLETLFTSALSNVDTASVDGGMLTLSGPNSELVFESTSGS